VARSPEAHLHRAVHDHRQRSVGVEAEVPGEVEHRIEERSRGELVLGGLEGGRPARLAEALDPGLLPQVGAADRLRARRAPVGALARRRPGGRRDANQLVRLVSEDAPERLRVAVAHHR
jgi:hypothetical protein